MKAGLILHILVILLILEGRINRSSNLIYLKLCLCLFMFMVICLMMFLSLSYSIYSAMKSVHMTSQSQLMHSNIGWAAGSVHTR